MGGILAGAIRRFAAGGRGRLSRPKPCTTEHCPHESQEARFVENVDLDAIEQSSPRSMVRAIDLLTGKALRGFGLTVCPRLH
jgi:hypothetical protein